MWKFSNTNSFGKLWIILFIFPFANTETSKEKGRNYIHNRSGENYFYLQRNCSYFDCREGGCRYRNCGNFKNIPRNEEEDGFSTHCSGGLCEFIDTVNPTCKGGACTFIRCQGASCDGGGCHHIHPKETLKEGYCYGGGCRLNDELIPNTAKDNLSS